jgi:rhodanese-related sulfurtransferase
VNRLHRALATAAAVLAAGAAATELGSRVDPVQLAAEIDAERDHISALELAERIMARDSTLRIYDLRSPEEYQQLHIPSAQLATLEQLAREDLPRVATIVLYSEGGAHAAQAWLLLRMRGYENVAFLREGLYEWIARVLEPRLAVDASPAERADFQSAAELSRFFGGVPRAEVPREEVPAGYWSHQDSAQPAVAKATAEAVKGLRRRGC